MVTWHFASYFSTANVDSNTSRRAIEILSELRSTIPLKNKNKRFLQLLFYGVSRDGINLIRSFVACPTNIAKSASNDAQWRVFDHSTRINQSSGELIQRDCKR